jgi:hypothetical protein
MAVGSPLLWWRRARAPASDPVGSDWSPVAGALRFALIMLAVVGLATVAAVASARAVLPPEIWEESQSGFTRQAAIEVVAARFPISVTGRQHRRNLRTNGRVEYHSSNHWTVRLGDATWTAHASGGPGPNGRYAEPDNDAARQLEAEAAGS